MSLDSHTMLLRKSHGKYIGNHIIFLVSAHCPPTIYSTSTQTTRRLLLNSSAGESFLRRVWRYSLGNVSLSSLCRKTDQRDDIRNTK